MDCPLCGKGLQACGCFDVDSAVYGVYEDQYAALRRSMKSVGKGGFIPSQILHRSRKWVFNVSPDRLGVTSETNDELLARVLREDADRLMRVTREFCK